MRDSLRRLASNDEMGDIRPRRSYGKTKRVQAELLDGTLIEIDVDRKARGGDLLDKVCESLDIREKDYFGLQREARDRRLWIDLGKRLSKTFKNEPWDVRLAFKFYPPEPSQLLEDLTRYQLTLAVRRDLLEGRLSCSSITSALLASYILQAELGDCESETAIPLDMLSELHVADKDDPGMLMDKIMQFYQNHKGLTPAESELSYLENAKKLFLYGAELHPALDCEDVEIALGVCANGISVYRDNVLLNRFPWAKILKISFNKRAFILELRPTEYEEVTSVVTFRVMTSRASKELWKSSVEQHMFFRRATPVSVARVPGWGRLGSRTFSCRRTLTQLRAV